MAQTNTQSAQTLPLSYIVAAADGHVGVSWGDLLARAWARQVVVVDAAGVVAGDGGERVQRQIPVQQTARQAERERERLLTHTGFIMLLVQLVSVVLSVQKWKTIPSKKFSRSLIDLMIYVKYKCAFVLLAGVRRRAVGARLCNFDLQDGSFVVGAGQQDEVILKEKHSMNTASG